MLAMIAGLHSPRRKPQVNATDQVFGTYTLPSSCCGGRSQVLPRLAYLTLCRSIQLLVQLARGDAARLEEQTARLERL